MKTFLKWTLLALVVIAVGAFGAFLYLIPPFFTTPPEEFGKAMADCAAAGDRHRRPGRTRDRRSAAATS